MRTLVVGTGGREHALALALVADPAVTEVHAAPDDQDPHQPSRSTIVCSRPGPTPTAQNGAPDISSSALT